MIDRGPIVDVEHDPVPIHRAPAAGHPVSAGPTLPNRTAHEEAIAATRNAVRNLAVFSRVEEAVGAERAEAVTLLLIAVAERLAPARRDELTPVLAEGEHDEALAAEIASLRDQLRALWTIISDARAPRSA